MRFLLIFSFLLSIHSFAQDTLVVTGKIENLTIQLYRQAETIKISRMNLLRGHDEIAQNVALQADGRFKAKVPLVYPIEECVLSYGRWVTAPFLAQKGSLSITIFGDSLNTSKIPFRFSGLNAVTNNRHALFEVSLANFIKSKKEYDNIFKKLAKKSALAGWEFLQEFRDSKKIYYSYFKKDYPTDALLDRWVAISLNEGAKANYFEHLYYLNERPSANLSDSIQIDTSAFMTFSKADLSWQFYRHAFSTIKSNINSLRVEQMADLLLKYVSSLSDSERQRLEAILKTKEATNKDLKFLSDIFSRNNSDLSLISAYEVLVRQLGSVFNLDEIELFKGMIWAQTAKNLTLKNANKLYRHVEPQVQNKLYVKALRELYALENKDSLAIDALKGISFTNYDNGRFGNYLVRAMPQTYLYKNEYQIGSQILDGLKTEFRGQKMYLIYWKTIDENCIENLKESVALRNFLPESDILFVYICDSESDEQLWKETIVKNKLQGVHILSASSRQDDYFEEQFVRLQSLPYCAIIDEKGKWKTLEAPLPTDYEGWDKLLKNWK